MLMGKCSIIGHANREDLFTNCWDEKVKILLNIGVDEKYDKNSTLIINLPGSPKGAVENLLVILSVIPHGIEILKGEASACAR